MVLYPNPPTSLCLLTPMPFSRGLSLCWWNCLEAYSPCHSQSWGLLRQWMTKAEVQNPNFLAFGGMINKSRYNLCTRAPMGSGWGWDSIWYCTSSLSCLSYYQFHALNKSLTSTPFTQDCLLEDFCYNTLYRSRAPGLSQAQQAYVLEDSFLRLT